MVQKHTEYEQQTSNWFTSARKYVGRYEFVVLFAIFVVAGGAWFFMVLAGEVTEGTTQALDERLLLALRTNPQDLGDPFGPPWVEEMMRDITALGGFAILTLLTSGVFIFLLLQGKPHAALFLVVVVVGGALLSTTLKGAFDRPRPDLVPHGSYVQNASFPSGHSMLSAAVYLTLGALLARLQSGRALKLYVLGIAVLLTVLVGISRVYLGVHWPTDVLAGWAVGAAWAAGCLLVARWLQRRGHVEGDEEAVTAPK
jgi:undecaprenyl-diphosphatase